LVDILAKLFFGTAGIAGGTFGLHNGQNVAGWPIKTVIGDSIPRGCVVSRDWNFEGEAEVLGDTVKPQVGVQG
jgi:hypothetical protein